MDLKPAEAAEVEDIVRGILAVQARTAKEENRSLCRATHAKGICARAVFEVFDVASGRDPTLAARLAKGLYAAPGTYPATVRFSNADSNVNGDWRLDVRALSFCVEGAPAGTASTGAPLRRQDYSLQSAPILPFNDVHAFCVFAKVMGAPSQTAALNALPFRDQLIFARTMIGVMEQSNQPVRPYQLLRYWSNVPFHHGPDDIVKFSATPAAINPACALDLKQRNPGALSDELRRHLNEDSTMSSFDFSVQFLDLCSMTYQGRRQDADFWIENAAIEWPETQAPFHAVGRLTLLPRSELSAEASAALYFDVNGNSTAASTPVGGINRVRWFAEIASRRARMATP